MPHLRQVGFNQEGDWRCIPYGCMAQRQGKRKVRRREKRIRGGPGRRTASQCRLGPWATRNANLAWSHHQEFPELKIVSVFTEHGIEVFDLGLKAGSRETEENDAGVSEFLLEDQFAEIAVGDDQDPLLFAGDCKDILIGKTMRIIARDCLNVVSETS